MKQKNYGAALALLLVLALGVSGCGAQGSSSTASTDYANPSPRSGNEGYAAETKGLEGAAQEEAGARMDGGAFSQNTIEQMAGEGRKIIYEATLSVEALDYDATCAAVLKAMEAAGGNIASTDMRNGSWEGATRYATYVLRIPAQKYSGFLQAVGQAGNITSQQENSQDITAEYVDVEARLKSLHTQEERLMEMLEGAGELETLLAIQDQLMDVQYRIESYTSQKNTYDDLVSYSTVTVQVDEVRRITQSKHTFGEKVGSAFRDSWYQFGLGLQRFAVDFVAAIPTLLLLGVLGLIGFVVSKKLRRIIHAKKASARIPRMPGAKAQEEEAPEFAQGDKEEQ